MKIKPEHIAHMKSAILANSRAPTLPSHPQGFGQHGESAEAIDYPRYSQLGRKIKFSDLPPDCQRLILSDYLYLWDLPGARE